MLNQKTTSIEVFEGFVELIDTLGTDLDIANAARVSFKGFSPSMGDKDIKLMKYLWMHQHTSPFRMVTCKFRVKAPIFVLRQWMKHTIGCTWNEVSARYVEVEEQAFVPHTWRLQHKTSKQSSYGEVKDDIAEQAHAKLMESYEIAFKNYNWMLDQGICREQARVQLPVGMYSECIWKADLQAVLHFLALRLDEHAQAEIREFAQAILRLVTLAFPISTQLFLISQEVDQRVANEKLKAWDEIAKQLSYNSILSE